MKDKAEQRLLLGQKAFLKKGFTTIESVTYAGMPAPNVYSLAVIRERGSAGTGYNLFLPLDQREIELEFGRVIVYEVSPHEICLRIEKPSIR